MENNSLLLFIFPVSPLIAQLAPETGDGATGACDPSITVDANYSGTVNRL